MRPGALPPSVFVPGASGRATQQRVQFVWPLPDGALYRSGFVCRLPKLQGHAAPAIKSMSARRTDNSVHVTFCCGSDACDVTPPAEWDGVKWARMPVKKSKPKAKVEAADAAEEVEESACPSPRSAVASTDRQQPS